ncbi:N-6 DNA methylase [Nocardioides sp. R-C-SC26]|uniref:N-6 DNA methylase n=1 Tax=Nocardioides sp. R-C-SC26 TaxID=2870414 RepID=UPI001E64945A|nr:N-6 DNA methylase [Nocardioides sp. R-C-SC26]
MERWRASVEAAAARLDAPIDVWQEVLAVLDGAPAPRDLEPWTEDGAIEHLGAVYESLVERRAAEGVYYTPPALADWMVDRVAEAWPIDRRIPRVLDPACGTGNLLLALARRLVDLGHPARQVVQSMHGTDVDDVAVRIARARLRALAGPDGADVIDVGLEAGLRRADGLATVPGGPFDVVLGNPPFLGQMRRATRRPVPRSAPGTRVDASDSGSSLGPYADVSARFLEQALRDHVAGDGVVALVQPWSVLAARDTASVRRLATDRGGITAFWASRTSVFPGVSVLACVVVVRCGATDAGREAVPTWHGPGFQRGPDIAPPELEWGPLAAPSVPLPVVRPVAARGSRATLAALATATSDFRDQFYGLVPHVTEAPDLHDVDRWAPLITSGLIEPGLSLWGRRAATFAGRRLQRPVVDLSSLAADERLATWAAARRVPKVLVAAQGRVIEGVADPDGVWLPSVPVVSVVPDDVDGLWRVLAVLTAPPIAAATVGRYLGAGRSATSHRFSARQLLDLPLPVDAGAWQEAADLLRAGAAEPEGMAWPRLEEVAVAMARAYREDDATPWWLSVVGRSHPDNALSTARKSRVR